MRITTNLVVMALEAKTPEAFLFRVTGQSPWYDAENWDEINEEMRSVYSLAHGGIPALLEHYDMTMREFSNRFAIPYRTVQDWKCGERTCPTYVIGMAIEILSRSEEENQ